MAMDTFLFPSIDNFKNDKVDMADLEYVIIQEKLDGCNFRIIYNRLHPGDEDTADAKPEIQFGSRTVVFDDKTSFHGYQRIRPELEAKIRALAQYDDLRDKSFIVFGELVGYNAGGKPILNRFKYFDDTKVVKYFAYEIYVENETDLGLIDVTKNDENTEDDAIGCIASRMEFFRAQELLQKTNFDLIPYTIMYAAEYSYEKLLDFKSIYFDHNDFKRIEGYVLRFKFANQDQLMTYKLKPENLDQFKDKLNLRPFDDTKTKNSPKVDGRFLDYISKVPYLDDDQKLIDSSYVEICMREYQKETNITSKKDFGEFYKNLLLYCRERPNFNELLKKFSELVAANTKR